MAVTDAPRLSHLPVAADAETAAMATTTAGRGTANVGLSQVCNAAAMARKTETAIATVTAASVTDASLPVDVASTAISSAAPRPAIDADTAECA